MVEYLKAVDEGLIPSAAPEGAAAAAAVYQLPSQAADRGVTNNYSRSEGQARAGVKRGRGARQAAAPTRATASVQLHRAAAHATPPAPDTPAQNLGNFLTDRNTSRVLAPPGGASTISLGDGSAGPPPPKVRLRLPAC